MLVFATLPSPPHTHSYYLTLPFQSLHGEGPVREEGQLPSGEAEGEEEVEEKKGDGTVLSGPPTEEQEELLKQLLLAGMIDRVARKVYTFFVFFSFQISSLSII